MNSYTFRGSELSLELQDMFRKKMQTELAQKPWIADRCLLDYILVYFKRELKRRVAVIPDFPVSCRRITPGPGYLQALCADNVSLRPYGP